VRGGVFFYRTLDALMIDSMRVCNFCVVADLRKMAAQMSSELVLVPQRLYEANEQCSQTFYCASGVAMYIDGARVAWMASVPKECICILGPKG